jgi:hypothetical protein
MDKIKDKPIIVVDTENKKNEFILSCENIYRLSKINNNLTFCGIDFEFNMNWSKKTRYIASMQIIFIFNSEKYHMDDFEKPVYILDPMKLNTNQIKLFIKYILCSHVIKIFHGSDSLDYPHIFTDILNNNKKKFIKFVNYSIDTRFMCEISKRLMHKIGLNIKSNKCSIYNALNDLNVISDDIFNKLEGISSKINYNKPWIINKLSENQIIYSAYDVMYLYDLVEKITLSISPLNTQNEHNIDPISLVNRLYRFHMLNKLQICNFSQKCKYVYDSYKNNKKETDDSEEKIMEMLLTTIQYTDKNSNVHNIDLLFDDILFVDTIRKSILICLKVYQINKQADIDKINKYLVESKVFNLIRGKNSILKMINIIHSKKISEVNNIICNI